MAKNFICPRKIKFFGLSFFLYTIVSMSAKKYIKNEKKAFLGLLGHKLAKKSLLT